MTEELKPCPFCGGEAQSISTTYGNGDAVECKRCHATSADFMYGGDINGEYTSKYYQAAREAWNTRANE